MVYTTNPKMPRLRAKAVEMVHNGKGVREVARYLGYSAGTISKWLKKAPSKTGVWQIPTVSSRPHTHPKRLPQEQVEKIKLFRLKTNGRCAEVIQKMLEVEGVVISLSSVKRELDRLGMTKKRSVWARKWKPIVRPLAQKAGDLVQMDTIHLMLNAKERIYIYTLLDVYSRWAFAVASAKINTHQSVRFFELAAKSSPFKFNCIQSDHGPEFSQNFSERIEALHRHSRVRRPNDNAHLERFNRTIQQELIQKVPLDVDQINQKLPAYLKYYNEERLHLGLNLKTPHQIISNVFPSY